MRLRHRLLAAVILASAIPLALPTMPAFAQAPQAQDAVLQSMLAAPHRSDANRARDQWRHPAETMSFWGLKPGDTILEISPGAGWWTEILAPYARQTGGRYITTGAVIDGPGATDASRAGRKAFEDRYADAAVFGKVEIVPFSGTSRGLGAPGSVDVAFTARNVHNWIGSPGRVDAIFADLFAVIKPGGYLGVKDHRSDPQPMKPGASDGYVSEAFVIEAAQKAGFVLDARSEINANPRDTKDHPFGVWTLPPVGRSAPAGAPANPAFDRTRFDAIGESDRMTLRFRKPG
jgi:predicted methyltransferase